VGVLKELGKQAEAQDLIDFYADGGPKRFWDVSNDPFQRGPLEEEVAAVVQSQLTAKDVPFDPEAELLKSVQTYDAEAIRNWPMFQSRPITAWSSRSEERKCGD